MKFIGDKLKNYWKRIRDFCVYKVLHADDPPHQLALGIGIGMFVTFTPTIGFQMGIVVFLAWLLRANKLVGVPLVWISNPFTLVPIYYACYWVGCRLLNMQTIGDEFWDRMMSDWESLTLTQPTWSQRVYFWWERLLDIATPLWVGCIVVGLVLGVISYYVSLFAIRNYRLKRWGQLLPPKLTPTDHQSATHPESSNTADGNAT